VIGDLINDYIGKGSEHQFPTSRHAAARAAKVRKLLQSGARVIDRSRQLGAPRPDCRVLSFRRYAPNLPLPAATNGLSRLQEPLKPLANLFMSEIFTPLESFFTALHGLCETSFFLEIARNNILHQLVRLRPCRAAAWVSFASTSGGKCTSIASAPTFRVRHPGKGARLRSWTSVRVRQKTPDVGEAPGAHEALDKLAEDAR
jgi:hypothetical protein